VEAADPAYPIAVEASITAVGSDRPKPEAGPPDNTRERTGEPVALAAGITESVGEIMAREKAAPPSHPTRPREKYPEFEQELQPQEDPSAPAVSHWPPIVDSKSTKSPAAPLFGPPDLPQTLGTSFKAAGISEAPFIPPDSMGDVGPTQILIHVNGLIRTYTKSGVADGALNATDAQFWTSVAGPQGISDPEVRYDRLSGRWFVLAISIAESVNNKIVLAVSSGPTITSQSSFTFYFFNVGVPSPSDSTSFCDYPSLGVDANAVYTGCNMFASTGSFRWTSAFVVQKSSVLSGGPIVVTGFGNITSGVTAGPYAPAAWTTMTPRRPRVISSAPTSTC